MATIIDTFPTWNPAWPSVRWEWERPAWYALTWANASSGLIKGGAVGRLLLYQANEPLREGLRDSRGDVVHLPLCHAVHDRALSHARRLRGAAAAANGAPPCNYRQLQLRSDPYLRLFAMVPMTCLLRLLFCLQTSTTDKFFSPRLVMFSLQ